MRKWLNLYFDLSRGELNGLLTMMVLIFLIALTPRVYVLLRPDLEDLPSERLAIQQLSEQMEAERHPYPVRHSEQFTPGSSTDPSLYSHDSGNHSFAGRSLKGDELGYFDPNTLSAAQWQQLGLSARQAHSVRKYIDKGGRFKRKEDLQKMYTISPEVYERIESYVRITAAESPGDRNGQINSHDTRDGSSKYASWSPAGQSTTPKKAALIIEINRADSLLLDEIRGIGPAFAHRIIKYRERLGGFHKKEQLREVFGLDSNKYEELKDQVRVDASFLKKIDINTATFEELRNHPYLKYKQINAIIQYRKQHGQFKSAEDLSKIVILDAETLTLLQPYLSF